MQIYIQASRLLKGLCLAGPRKECLQLFAQMLSQKPQDACLSTGHALQAALKTTAGLIEANAGSAVEQVRLLLYKLLFPPQSEHDISSLLSSKVGFYACCSFQVKDKLLDALGLAYQNASLEVRTASNECIVELRFKLGAEGIEPLTSRLTGTQARVVALQFDRVCKSRQT